MGRGIANGLSQEDLEKLLPLLEKHFGKEFHIYDSVKGFKMLAVTLPTEQASKAQFFVMGWRAATKGA